MIHSFKLPTRELRLCLGFTLFMVSVACSKAPSAIDHLVLQLNWIHQAAFAGYYVADQQSFYADQQLQVDIREVDSSLNFAELLASGDLDFAVASPAEFVQAQALGGTMIAVAATFQIPPEVLFALADSGIRSVQDLPGRRVAIVNESWRLIIRQMLQNVGLDPASVIEVDVPAGAIEMLYRGEVDVWSGYIGDEPIEAIIHGHPINLIYVADYNGAFYGDLLLANQDLIDNNPDLVARFVQATIKGWQFAISNPIEAAQIVSQWQPNNPESFHLEALYRLLPLIAPGQDPIGWIDQSKWEATLAEHYDSSRPGYTSQFIPRN